MPIFGLLFSCGSSILPRFSRILLGGACLIEFFFSFMVWVWGQSVENLHGWLWRVEKSILVWHCESINIFNLWNKYTFSSQVERYWQFISKYCVLSQVRLPPHRPRSFNPGLPQPCSNWVLFWGLRLFGSPASAAECFLSLILTRLLFPWCSWVSLRIPFERSTEGVVVASFDVICEVPIPADQFGAAIFFNFLMNLAIILVGLGHEDPSLGLHLRHQHVFQLLHLPTYTAISTSLYSIGPTVVTLPLSVPLGSSPFMPARPLSLSLGRYWPSCVWFSGWRGRPGCRCLWGRRRRSWRLSVCMPPVGSRWTTPESQRRYLVVIIGKLVSASKRLFAVSGEKPSKFPPWKMLIEKASRNLAVALLCLESQDVSLFGLSWRRLQKEEQAVIQLLVHFCKAPLSRRGFLVQLCLHVFESERGE